jgi:hypothetical protein
LAILLRFQKAGGGQLRKGPFDSLVFEGETIRDREGGTIVARHLPHCWQVDGDEFLRLDFDPAVAVTWDGHPKAAATTGQLHCVNGVTYIDRRMFAVADRERRDWYILRDGQHRATLRVEPA